MSCYPKFFSKGVQNIEYRRLKMLLLLLITFSDHIFHADLGEFCNSISIYTHKLHVWDSRTSTSGNLAHEMELSCLLFLYLDPSYKIGCVAWDSRKSEAESSQIRNPAFMSKVHSIWASLGGLLLKDDDDELL